MASTPNEQSDALEKRIKQLESELAGERNLTRSYLEISGSMDALVTPDEKIHLINRRGCEILGYKREELIGKNWFETIIPADQQNKHRVRFRELMTGRDLFRKHLEGQVLTKRGEKRDINWNMTVLRDPSGAVIGELRSGEDITEERRAKQTIEYMAYHDELTRLPNRAFLQRHLDIILERAQKQQWTVALLFMDFDNFKQCNDLYGHAAGDDMLREISRRLRELIRPADTLIRLGGDEFVMIASDLDGRLAVARQQSQGISSRIRDIFRVPFDLGEGRIHQSGTSIGVSLCPYDTLTGDDLLGKADQAMYAAKQGGKDRWVFYADLPRQLASGANNTGAS